MTVVDRLEKWREQGAITPEQFTHLSGLARDEPFSLFVELNVFLYAGVLAFIAGLGWTVNTWSQQIGDVIILAILSAILTACLWYCFSRARPWSPAETKSPNLIFDYVLYLGCLTWSVELAYLENRFHLLSGQWDDYALATAVLFFFLAYRFDNRFVLSLALSSLAGWFGLTLSRWPSFRDDAAYRESAILYSLVVGAAGAVLRQRGWKPHFFDTYLNVAANVLFWAVLSGVFQREGGIWLFALLLACGAALAWGVEQRQFAFVAYAAVYGYIGVSSMLTRNMSSGISALMYFVVTGSAMLIMLVAIARRFGRDA